ncbi:MULTISPECIES: hypothetical protein [unclassified Roseovarius]|uniref:hypothetical protein n=1 Tax=unclassified Roseovarius TaxID=2614913 RepID=UPI00273EA9F7|nr:MULTISPECIES: hypothetical protein [unclassified Roseovarius]
MYQEDSFLTLGAWGRVGLVILSLCLAMLMLWVVRIAGRGRGIALRILLAFLLFWAFLWLSPQIYYLYYLMLFDGLPWQNVVQPPPSPSEVLKVLSFTDEISLSNHGKGVLGWAMILCCFWTVRR